MYKCATNREFIDKYTGKVISGVVELSEERIKEIKEVDKTLITVLGKIEVETEHSVVVDFTPDGVTEPIEEVNVEDVQPPKKPRTKKTTK